VSRLILPEPPPELKRLSHALSEKIQLEIAADGFIPFARYMEMALYEPGLGYYSAGLYKLGKSGDFITAPELGSLFAACLARQVEEVAAQLEPYDILELGAGTGKLAADLLQQLPLASQPRRYLILERSADLQAVQQQLIAERVPQWQERVQWLTQPPAAPWDGIVLANEVLDALAVERFRLGVFDPRQASWNKPYTAWGWNRIHPTHPSLTFILAPGCKPSSPACAGVWPCWLIMATPAPSFTYRIAAMAH